MQAILFEDEDWKQSLNDACFPVTLTDVHVGDPARRAHAHRAHRYRAIVRANSDSIKDPFAIVTNRYRLISNEDVIDLGHAAFEHLFGLSYNVHMSVFNVALANGGGSFIADFTSPELNNSIRLPESGLPFRTDSGLDDQSRHVFFLRVVNSYTRAQAVGIEVGICRWICRNGIIFGKHSVNFRNRHSKTKQQLLDQIAGSTARLPIDKLRDQIEEAYTVSLLPNMTVLEGVCQTLKLAIPPVNRNSRTARLWKGRCCSLKKTSNEYEEQFGCTAFSVFQAASQWAQSQAHTSPIQRHSFERRVGEMLESLISNQIWPDREENWKDKIERIEGWSVLSLPTPK